MLYTVGVNGNQATDYIRLVSLALGVGLMIGLVGMGMISLRTHVQQAKLRGLVNTPLAPQPPANGAKLTFPAGLHLPRGDFLLVLLPSCKTCSKVQVDTASLLKARSMPLVLCLTDPISWYDDAVRTWIKNNPVMDVNDAASLPYQLLELSPCAIIVDKNHAVVRYITGQTLHAFLDGTK